MALIKVESLVHVDIVLLCDECKNQLDFDDRSGGELRVTPCSNCLDTAKTEGHEEGHKEGYDEAKEEFTPQKGANNGSPAA